jgi:hypothetical protein
VRVRVQAFFKAGEAFVIVCLSAGVLSCMRACDQAYLGAGLIAYISACLQA